MLKIMSTKEYNRLKEEIKHLKNIQVGLEKNIHEMLEFMVKYLQDSNGTPLIKLFPEALNYELYGKFLLNNSIQMLMSTTKMEEKLKKLAQDVEAGQKLLKKDKKVKTK